VGHTTVGVGHTTVGVGHTTVGVGHTRYHGYFSIKVSPNVGRKFSEV